MRLHGLKVVWKNKCNNLYPDTFRIELPRSIAFLSCQALLSLLIPRSPIDVAQM